MLQNDARSHLGQVLVVVALALLALVGIVALAVDGGHVYAERRKMQNAADAGALAGARALCLESASTSEVETVAQEYAIDLNGAHGAVVTVSGPFTVTVVVTETAPTFFARAIGFAEVEVSARASAMCQGPSAGAGIWPLAVGENVYDQSCTNPSTCIMCGELFYAYISDPTISWATCAFPATRIERAPGPNECSALLLGEALDANADGLPDVDKVQHIDSDSRGWLDLQIPLEPYPDYCKNASCGVPNVECWITNGHPGPISRYDCIAGESGNMNSLKDNVNTECNKVRNLLLFDRTCNGTPPEGEWYQCSSNITPGVDYYRITGFGCMRVIGYYDAWFDCGGKENKAQVVIVQKLCSTPDHPIDYNNDGVDDCTALAPGSGNPADIDEYIVIQLTE